MRRGCSMTPFATQPQHPPELFRRRWCGGFAHEDLRGGGVRVGKRDGGVEEGSGHGGDSEEERGEEVKRASEVTDYIRSRWVFENAFSHP